VCYGVKLVCVASWQRSLDLLPTAVEGNVGGAPTSGRTGVDLLLTRLQLCTPAYGEAHMPVAEEAGPERRFGGTWGGQDQRMWRETLGRGQGFI
jgi:hypothetical protein